MRLKDKVAIITGAARGIGEATAIRFAQEGAKVVVSNTGLDSLNEVVEKIKEMGGEVLAYDVNVTNREQIQSMVDDVVAKWGQVDILVNNAGITADSQLLKMEEADFDKVIDVNLKGVYNCGQIVAKIMAEKDGGVILNASSVVGLYGNIGQANYAATKAGVLGLTMTWAKEFARKGANVRVNAIAPGYIMTDILKTVPQDLLDQFAAMTMLKRLGQPHEIAQTALFLASDDASYITGQTISVNGGMRL